MYHQFNIQQFYVLPTQCIYVFCVDLRTNSDYFDVRNFTFFQACRYTKDEPACLGQLTLLSLPLATNWVFLINDTFCYVFSTPTHTHTHTPPHTHTNTHTHHLSATCFDTNYATFREKFFLFSKLLWATECSIVSYRMFYCELQNVLLWATECSIVSYRMFYCELQNVPERSFLELHWMATCNMRTVFTVRCDLNL